MGLLAGLLKKRGKGVIGKEWELFLGSNITSQLGIGHTDEETIVIGTSSGNVYAVNSSGKIKWNFSAGKALTKEEAFFSDQNSFKIKSAPVVADINNDGKGEIIFGTGYGTLYALDCKGKLMWSFKAKDAISGSALAYDINNDKKLEILFGSSDCSFYCLSNSGKLMWSFNAGSGIESQANMMKTKNQIIFGTNDGAICSLNAKGRKMWEFKAIDKMIAQPSIGQLYNDGREFVVLGSLDNNLYVLDDEGRLHWFFETEGKIFSKALLADINNDNKLEIIFGSCDDKLHVVSSAGSRIWDYETDFWVVASPIIDDFNNDNKLEISIGSYDGFVYILDAEGDYRLGYMPGIAGITAQMGHYTDMAMSEPGSYAGNVLSRFKTDGMVLSLGFLRQGKSIVAASGAGKLYKLNYKNI